MFELRSLALETTTVCNSKCVVCPHDTLLERPLTHMTTDLFEKVMWDVYRNHRLMGPVGFGGGMGDAGCDKHLLERLRFVRRNMPEYQIDASSNMALWKRDWTDAVVGERLMDKMRFSLLAYTDAGSLRMYKRADQVRKACEAIDYFLERNRAAGNPVTTEIYTLLVPEDEGDVEGIKARYWDQVDLFEVWRPHSWANLFPELRTLTAGRMRCSKIAAFDLLVCVDGDVTSCTMDINHQNVYGNLNHQTVEEVFAGKAFAAYVEANEAGDLGRFDLCRNCVFINDQKQEVLLEAKSRERDERFKVGI
ncbi:SPASM domain-containing protein [Magnetospirillum sp. UT-4]|uniref:SPASM domain-containing protein n=1 Tax=Magnetospirillum sp. UT-4 TaxID=2681467 RepID=UPI0013845EEF|nr:SPASM domain-containing protein [Magnetospirillum sp. UT-4]CAA7621675.1 hypothetical protein MTBUT4_40066 [Magnetospirillum sp. UT-4]